MFTLGFRLVVRELLAKLRRTVIWMTGAIILARGLLNIAWPVPLALLFFQGVAIRKTDQ